MNFTPNVPLDRIEEADFKLRFQYPKCLNAKELVDYISASASDMCSLSVNPDKCAILQETVNKICQIKLAEECGGSSDDLQKSEVSSSKPNLFGNDLVGPILLQALDGFLFMVNTEGKIEFVTANVKKFLKYSQESLIDKTIYNIIHVGDHARFSSNLLPMSIGNGFGWSEPNSKSRSFNCRFLIEPPEDQEETMEEKQTRVSQYENMQISAVLLPFSTDTQDLHADIQNHLVCVARRLPPNEKNNAPGVENFLTRLDLHGKIISIDTSGVSAAYSEYVNKDLVGQNILELTHPEDVQKVTHHLKETLQQGSNTSGVYRFHLHQKILPVQSQSKRCSEPEIIVAHHTILRDSVENNAVVSQRNNPSPASASVPSVGSNNMNGNSYSFATMSSPEFLNDIGLDFLPTSSWDLGGAEDLGDTTSVSLPLGGGPSTPANSRTQHPSGSAFSPELLSGRGSPSMRSPAQLSTTGSPAPGRVTPFSNTFPFSPVSTQTVSRTSSPAPNLIKREEPALPGSAELSNLSPISGLIGECQTNSAAQKLRNLLTHGIEEADSSVPKTSAEKIDDAENGFSSNSDLVSSRNENIILRELLNQEDEELRDEGAKTLSCDSNCNVNLSTDMCSNNSVQKRTVNNNNMLRKLLNNDESYKKDPNEDIIQELLKNEKCDPESLRKSIGDLKRKTPDTPSEDPLTKRHNPQHAHLAGQNPMLASMLAQTPRTSPSVPTSVANAIVSQLPQERLPKNLEKKLVHTPYTGAPTSASNSQYSFTPAGARGLLSTSLQQEVVTADTRGHVTLAVQNNMNYSSQTGDFLGKIHPNSSGLNLQGYQNQYLTNAQSMASTSNQPLFDDPGTDSSNAASSDPMLSLILDDVYSMEQDMNISKILEDLPDCVPAASPQTASARETINYIQRQLMSYEVPQQQPARIQRFANPMAPNAFTSNNPFPTAAPPAYTLTNTSTQRVRAPGLHPNMVPQMGSRQGLPQYGGLPQNLNDLSPQMKQRIYEQRQKVMAVQQQQKRLLLQQKQQQQLSLNTRPDALPPASAPFPEGMGDLLNNTVAPNVTLQRSASMPEPQLSPRYSVQQTLNAGPPQSPSQLSPGQRQQPPFSQQYANYPQSRLSPHGQVWGQQRASQNNSLQQQNPMLNAQLSQASYGGQQQPRFPSQQQQQPRQMVVRSLPSPGSRNSPYSNPPDSPFHPPSPLYQPPPQPPQQRLQRTLSIPNRVNSPRGLGFGDPLLSPQPSPGSFNSPAASTYNPLPASSSATFSTDSFSSYDQQVYPTSIMDRNRGNGGNSMTSEYVRQELRAMVGARTQQQHQVHQQQMVQQMPAGSQSSSQPLSQADFDALGFSLDLGNDGPPTSPGLFTPSLLSVAGGAHESQSRTNSPRFQLEEQRPAEQKKSLLQQLLSEPP